VDTRYLDNGQSITHSSIRRFAAVCRKKSWFDVQISSPYAPLDT